MAKLLAKLEFKDLSRFEKFESELQCKKILKEISECFKAFSNFLSWVLYEIFWSEKSSKPEQLHFFSLCIAFNLLMTQKLISYRFVKYLTRSSIFDSKMKWIVARKELKAKNRAFTDLVYLMKLLKDNKKKFLIREKSMKAILTRSASNSPSPEKITPITLRFALSDDNNARPSREFVRMSSNNLQMEIDEFLVHFNLHLQMNLDHVFENRLELMLVFLSRIENFMKEIFGTVELETKIDLMRLIIRMTNATEFVYKIILLDIMNLEYLQYSQTLSLFVQVLRWELGLKRFKMK